MSAYTKMHQLQRRPPFSNAINQVPPQPPSPTKQEKPKPAPLDPPLPRQNSKTTPPSPPKVITDKNRLLEFHRVGFLGEVGPDGLWQTSNLRLHRVALHAYTKSRTFVERATPARSSPRRLSRPRRRRPRSVSTESCLHCTHTRPALCRNQDPSLPRAPQHCPFLRMF